MTLDEALLYDAEWWLHNDLPNFKTKKNILRDAVMFLRRHYGENYDAEGNHVVCDFSWQTDSFFSLIIREAIRND